MGDNLSLSQPKGSSLTQLNHYHPDSFNDYLLSHEKLMCHAEGPKSHDNCGGIPTMPGIAVSSGIVSPRDTMSAIHHEDFYLCSIIVNVCGGIKA